MSITTTRYSQVNVSHEQYEIKSNTPTQSSFSLAPSSPSGVACANYGIWVLPAMLACSKKPIEIAGIKFTPNTYSSNYFTTFQGNLAEPLKIGDYTLAQGTFVIFEKVYNKDTNETTYHLKNFVLLEPMTIQGVAFPKSAWVNLHVDTSANSNPDTPQFGRLKSSNIGRDEKKLPLGYIEVNGLKFTGDSIEFTQGDPVSVSEGILYEDATNQNGKSIKAVTRVYVNGNSFSDVKTEINQQ